MPRKPRKGYFIAGQFVAEGSELDLQLREERERDGPSRTQRKQDSDALQSLGADLCGLRQDALLALNLPERLLEALAQAARITDFEGRRRQMQFVGKLMRQLDEAQLQSVREALARERIAPARETRLLHDTEDWRARMLGSDGAVTEWLARFPATDSQQLRALLRQARKDTQAAPAGQAPRHGRAYRELFQTLRAQLALDGQAP